MGIKYFNKIFIYFFLFIISKMGISEDLNNGLARQKQKTDLIIVWLDKFVDNEENLKYQGQMRINLSKKYNLSLYPAKTIEKSISILKTIKFTKTIIIVSGKYYERFIEKFYIIKNEFLLKENIVVFCGSKKGLLFWCEINNIYIDENLVFDRFEDLNKYLIEQKITENDEQYSFEIIRNNNELILPIFYQDFFTMPSNESIYLFHNLLKESYKNNIAISKLLEQIDNVYDINILCKYWMRIYSEDTSFYKEMNEALRKRKNIFKYMTFVKMFYQSLKLNIFKPVIKKLYRGSIISKKEFENFKKFQEEKLKIPSLKMIIYSITFLSFSQKKNAAEQFILNEKEENIKILFEVIPNDLIETNKNNQLISNIDISEISTMKNELEVLFGPFSTFKFISIDNISNTLYYTNNFYIVRLEYLGKYRKSILEEFEEDKILNFIPPTKYSLELTKFDFLQLNFKLIWSIKKNLIKKLDNILFLENNIIASIDKIFLILNKNLEILDKQEEIFFEKIIGIRKLNDYTIVFYSHKNIKIFEFKENKCEKKCEYKFIQNIRLENENISLIYILSGESILVISDISIKILNKINNSFTIQKSKNKQDFLIISLIEFPDKYNDYSNSNFIACLSYEGELIFRDNNLAISNILSLSEKPIEHDMMLFKNYIIIILESSISLVDYEKKNEEFLFYLDNKSICFNKLTNDSFLISMMNKNNNYFFNEYKIKIEDNKAIIENLGNSNIEKEKIKKIMNLGNNEVLTLNENKIIFWKKNRKLIKYKETKRDILKMKEKEKNQIFNNFIDKNESIMSNSFFNSINGIEKEMNQEKPITINNCRHPELQNDNFSIHDRTCIFNNRLTKNKMIEESKIIKDFFPSPYNSLLLSTNNASKNKIKKTLSKTVANI